ncbi:MAG: DNA gyrase subunit A, partial [Atopobiaceae bacterium]|nr:DNA gyrase subunit A [Atopobiaceae bacterium]
MDDDDEVDDASDDESDDDVDDEEPDGEDDSEGDASEFYGSGDDRYAAIAEGGQRLDLSDIHGGTLKPADMASEMRTSFIEYSMSVIVARALPDVRDGLKPVHRRILYAMNEAGITPNRPHKKSAWTVGEVIGKYHPHGDSAVYDTMVRLAQDFSMRLPLVDGHGNFGSIDGDPPAAMRYTESRLTRAAMEMLRDLDKDTVDWQPNYDESLQEPAVLPARFPNLLVNGSSGIAVGMATNIPPHNLGEVIEATKMLIDNPDATTEELMTVLPGPDFPTGGTIMGSDGIKDAYETGRGSITVRAKAHVEQMKGNRQRIVVTEVPYQVNKGLLQEKIAELVNEKRLEGISDMRDETNRKGMRLVFDLKQGAIPQVVLNNLYKHSQLQTNFGVIDLALVDGVPRTLSLREMLQYYINHQVDVVTRRTRYELKKAKERAHILEGLLIAVDNIDEVVHIIRSSESDKDAKARLEERFGLDDVQTEAILQMRLRRLTGLERQKIVDELDALKEKIAYYEDLLAHEDKILALIKDELTEISTRFADKRRSVISDAPIDLDVEDLIADEDMVITMTHSGYVKRLPVATYRSQKRGGKGIQGVNLKDSDFVEDLFIASTHDYVLFFTNFGKVYRLKVHELPIGSRQARGSAVVNFLPLAEGEHVAAVITCRDFPADEFLMFATKRGIVKKTSMSAYDRTRRDGIIAINLKGDDELVNVRRVRTGDKIMLGSTDGKVMLFDEADVRPMGRDTTGVRGITLKDDATMLGMEITNGKGDLFVITENG